MIITSTLRIAPRILVAVSAAGLLAGFAGGKDDGKSPAAKRYTSDVTIDSKFLARGFVPDGDVAKPAWQRAEWVGFNHSYLGDAVYPEAETEVASLWRWRTRSKRKDKNCRNVCCPKILIFPDA